MQEGEFHGAVGIRAPPGINGFALYVGGDVWAKTYRAANPPWADFVFDEQYDLPTLEEVEQHIRQHKHLPDIPSEAEIKKEKGIDLAVINAKLLQKIEELTLYLIDQNKRLQAVEQTNRELQQKIQTLTTHD